MAAFTTVAGPEDRDQANTRGGYESFRICLRFRTEHTYYLGKPYLPLLAARGAGAAHPPRA